MDTIDLERLTTERVSDRFGDLDLMSTLGILQCMNAEDREVPTAVARSLDALAAAVDLVADSLRLGGRLFYVGAGTSGRIGKLDAYECPPTFGTDPSLVQAVLAGGDEDGQANEEAEDHWQNGAGDLRNRGLTGHDVVLGISASGRTPYVAGALRFAREIGCRTVALSCNANAAISGDADVAIEVVVGPEVLAGSTRLKAGTAQKLVLNMISTAVMVKLGKVYRNYMVDMQSSNGKLRARSRRIVQRITGADEAAADRALQQSGYRTKVGIVMLMADVPVEEAEDLLAQADQRIRQALEYHRERRR